MPGKIVLYIFIVIGVVLFLIVLYYIFAMNMLTAIRIFAEELGRRWKLGLR